MSRSRHFRRVLGVVVVATVSLTWGAGTAFATGDDAPIDQSNSVEVDQSGRGCDVQLNFDLPDGCENSDSAYANSGANAAWHGLQKNGTHQSAYASDGLVPAAFATGLILAVAVGGDADAGAANGATSDNQLSFSPSIATGAAKAGNSVAVNEALDDEGEPITGQSNDNSGWAVTLGWGIGGSAILQSNAVHVTHDNNTALANSGVNLQGNTGQLSLTGQGPFATAGGSPALALSLGAGLAVAGDGSAFAINSAGPSEDGLNENSQVINSTITTGNATAFNSATIGTYILDSDDEEEGDQTIDQPFRQENINSGSAYNAVALDVFLIAGATVGQSNVIVIGPNGNLAIANSGLNAQSTGGQLTGTLQYADASASGGWAGSLGLFLGAGAFSGGADAAAANLLDVGNVADVHQTITTGDAVAQNYTGVNAAQSNDNSGNVGALQLLAKFGVGVGSVEQSNWVEVESKYNDAYANSGGNLQLVGPQGNGALQFAGAGAYGGFAGALGAHALAWAGDASAVSGNSADVSNESTVDNLIDTGDAGASNIASVRLDQSNANSGYVAGIAALDIIGVGIGYVDQDNDLDVDLKHNNALANSGLNVQGTSGQGNLVLQDAGSGSFGHAALAIGLGAAAIGGDASAAAVNSSVASNTQTIDNEINTGAAGAYNAMSVVADQSNSNEGNVYGLAKIAFVGVGLAGVDQSNDIDVNAKYNSATANSGGNLQFTGPQVNLTHQYAGAYSFGGNAYWLAKVGVGVAGDADAGAANFASSSNWQDIGSIITTGLAEAVNQVKVSAVQANSNSGDAKAGVLAHIPHEATSAINQSNSLEVSGGSNVAVANSGLNAQVVGGQANLTGQEADSTAVAGEASEVSVIASGAFDGDMTADAANLATSLNHSDVTSSITTGDATAMNQVSVDVSQENDNEGDSVAVGL